MIRVRSWRGCWSGWCGWLVGRRREWGMGNREREDVGTELTLSSRARREPPGDGRVEGSSRSRDASTGTRSEEHTSELQSLMRSSYAVFCLKKNKNTNNTYHT